MSETWRHPRAPIVARLAGRSRALIDSLAGSGKTESVAQLAVHLVLTGQVEPARITILAFNEKAAREDRVRVREVAERLLRPPTEVPAASASNATPGSMANATPNATPNSRPNSTNDWFEVTATGRQRLEDLLRAPPRVLTIHAWAQETLAREAFFARLPLHTELVPRQGAFRDAFLSLLRGRLARDEPAELQAWLAERSLERLEALLRRCTAEDPTTELRPQVDPAAARARLDDVLRCERRLWGALRSRVGSHDWGRSWRTRNKLDELLPRFRERLEAQAASGARLAVHAPTLAAEVAYLVEKTAPLATPELEPLLSALGALSAAHTSFDAVAANLWSAAARDAYAEHKRRAGVCDFDDLLLAFDEALAGDGGALAARVRARADVLIVDEVQDANALIYGYERAERGGDEGAEGGGYERAERGGGEGAERGGGERAERGGDEGAERGADEGAERGRDEGGAARGLFRPLFVDAAYTGRTVLCGDGHQAIYGWRAADVYGGFLRARDDMARLGAVVPLDDSFRSTPDLIAAMNELFRQDAQPPFFRGPIDYPRPAGVGRPSLRARGADGAEVVPVELLEVEARGARLSADELRLAVAQAIARSVDALRRDEGAITLEEQGKPPRRLGLDDVFVLTRTNREARQVQEVLLACDPPIPAVLHKAAGLFATAEAEDVAQLLAALAAPERHDLRRRALATPFFGVPLERLRGADALEPGDPLVQRWQRLVSRAERSVPQLLSSLLDESGLARRERLGGLPGARRAAVVQQVLDALLEHAVRVPGDLGGLVAHLGELRDEASRADAEDRRPIQQEAHEPAVRVMTVFAAKGLGAGVVFLTGGYTAWEDRDGARVYHAPAPERAADDPARPSEPVAAHVVAREAAPDARSEYPRYESPRVPPRFEVFQDERGRRVLHVGPLDEGAQRLFVASRREQDTFLLYTAVTRAIAKLVVPTVPWVDDAKPSWLYPYLAGSSYEPLNERLRAIVGARAQDPGLRRLFALHTVREQRAAVVEGAPEAWDRLETWSPPAVLLGSGAEPEGDGVRALVARHRAQGVVSYSSLKRRDEHHAELIPEGALLAGGSGDGDGAPSGVPAELLPGGRDVGNLCHGVLEHVALASCAGFTDPVAWGAQPAVEALLERQAARFGVPSASVPAVRDLVFHTLTRALCLGERVVPGLWTCAPVLREPAFRIALPAAVASGAQRVGEGLGERLALERGFLIGALDHVLRLPAQAEGGPPLLVGIDWKSDLLPDYGPAALDAKVRQDYPIQLAAYSYVLARLGGVTRAEDVGRGLDVRMAYVFLRGTGVAPSAQSSPRAGVGVYRLTPDAFRRYERFLSEVGA